MPVNMNNNPSSELPNSVLREAQGLRPMSKRPLPSFTYKKLGENGTEEMRAKRRKVNTKERDALNEERHSNEIAGPSSSDKITEEDQATTAFKRMKTSSEKASLQRKQVEESEKSSQAVQVEPIKLSQSTQIEQPRMEDKSTQVNDTTKTIEYLQKYAHGLDDREKFLLNRENAVLNREYAVLNREKVLQNQLETFKRQLVERNNAVDQEVESAASILCTMRKNK